MGRLVVVIPLREGTTAEVRALLTGGPPVELSEGDLDSYAAFVSSREAVLVLNGPVVNPGAGGAWLDVSAWKEGAAWARCLDAPPRLAEHASSSQRPPELTGVFFGPTPGPGDSEGGGLGEP
jgi:hypothetical protein